MMEIVLVINPWCKAAKDPDVCIFISGAYVAPIHSLPLPRPPPPMSFPLNSAHLPAHISFLLP